MNSICSGTGKPYADRAPVRRRYFYDGYRSPYREQRPCPDCGKFLIPQADKTFRPHKPAPPKVIKEQPERVVNPFVHCLGSYKPVKEKKRFSYDRGVCQVCEVSVRLLTDKTASLHKTKGEFLPCAECGELALNDYLCKNCRTLAF